MAETKQPQIYRIPEYIPDKGIIYFTKILQYDLRSNILGTSYTNDDGIWAIIGATVPTAYRGILTRLRLCASSGSAGYELRSRAWEEVVQKADEFGANLITLEKPKVREKHQYHFFEVRDASLQKALEGYLLLAVRSLQVNTRTGQQFVTHSAAVEDVE